MKKEKEIKLHYGALAEPLEEQLNKQGFTLGHNSKFIERLQDALYMCHFHLLTDSQYESCLKKLNKKVVSTAVPIEEHHPGDSYER